MASFSIGSEQGAAEQLAKRAEVLFNETPKIDAAVKNLLAVLMGRAQALGVTTKIHTIGTDGVEILEQLEDVNPLTLRQLCGVVLREVNAFELKEPLQWTEAHPQGDEQTGLDRIEDIAQYKAAFMLAQRVRSVSANNSAANESNGIEVFGGKLTKALGKSFLNIIWREIRPQIITKGSPIASQKIVEMLLDTLLPLPAEPEDQGQDNYAKEKARKMAENVEDLVWAKDFNAALYARSLKRKELVGSQNDASASASISK